MAEEDPVPVKFTVKRKTIAIMIEHEDGTEHAYTLKELDGNERDQYMNRVSKKMKSRVEQGLKDFSGMCSDLLSMSIYDENSKLVTAKVVQSWPSSTQIELFKMAANLSKVSGKDLEGN